MLIARFNYPRFRDRIFRQSLYKRSEAMNGVNQAGRRSMGVSRWRLAIVAMAVMVAVVGVLWMPASAQAAGRGPRQGTPAGQGRQVSAALAEEEAAGLLFMREEEKLARDLYNAFAEQWDLPIFSNIARSEQRHMDSVARLLTRYGLDDPTAGKGPGEFSDPALQALYDDLLAQGSVSVEAALAVGVLVEETDIADLDERLAMTTQPDITRVYTNLRRGSTYHLAAFQQQLGQ
jgi:hypothetical protein